MPGRAVGRAFSRDRCRLAARLRASVAGDVEALTMAITGRRAALSDLDGPGVATLAARL